jgi:hypothetical protein
MGDVFETWCVSFRSGRWRCSRRCTPSSPRRPSPTRSRRVRYRARRRCGGPAHAAFRQENL